MKKTSGRSAALALLTAAIWGTAFVAQSVGAEHVPPLFFNAARSLLAFLALLALCLVRRRFCPGRAAAVSGGFSLLLRGGFCCGTALALASYFQQRGLETTPAGKAGFITALYIILVPLAGTFLGRRPGRNVWLGVGLAVAGLYCLCVTTALTPEAGDVCVLLSALVFTLQILLVDRFAARLDGAALSCCQFFFVTLLSLAGSALWEQVSREGVLLAAGAICYAGILSSAVGYTLQILAQKGADPAVVSLLLSLEALFAAVSGALLRHDRLRPREYAGCALMLLAVVLAQLPERPRRGKRGRTREAGAAGKN